MHYIQNSPIHVHGNLKSSNVLIDSRWTSKVTDHGLFLFKEGQEIDVEAGREAKYYGMLIKTDSVQSSSNYLQKLFTKNLLTAC